MNKRLLTLIASAGLLHSVSYAAGCVVGGTDFDTKADLCCPILTSDNEEGGWYNEDLDLNKICKSNMFAELGSSIQKGIGGVFQTNSIIDMTNVDDVFHLETMILRGEGQYGYSTITAQPKLLHPFCMANESANNMFVNIGSTDDCPFLSYTVQGLEPGTAVELSFTLHNLMDISYFEYLISNGKDTSNFITNYSYSKKGTITGNSLKVGVVSSDDNVAFNTAYNNALMLVSSKNVTTATTAYGSSTKVTHKATVPENGYITFYFYRSNECFQIPIGIDDISVIGSVQPTLKYTGNPCPQMPVRIFTKQNYPEGTKYTWKESKTGQVSTDANFNFIPKDGDTDYTVNCEVTIPGCSAAKAEPFTIHSGNCCTTSDSVPMAMTYLFYDDFGNFVSNDTYEWTDRFGVTHTEKIPVGQVHTSQSHDGDIKIPFVQAYNIENSGAILAVPMAGGTKTELYNHGVYVISKFGGYPGGVKYDNSGTETGGMLQFDLSDDESQDEFFSIDFEHICTGKEVSFGADFASMSMHPGCIEVSLEYNGKTLASGYKSFTGADGWQSVNEHFTLQPSELGNKSEATLTMKIRHNKDCVPDFETRDYAIDNIFFSVCTPPDVNLESSVTTGKNILDLCTEDVLTLSSVTTDAVKQFYLYTNKAIDKTKKLGYVYQYTFQDPSTENEINKITWKTIHKDEVIEDEYFDIEINEYWDDIFSKMTNDDRIYFRVVVGEYSDLIADQSWMKASAFSPCRNVSISSIPVVAGLNCTACTSPDPVKFSAEGGVFNATQKTVVLEDGESTTLGMSNAVHGVDIDNIDYSNYDVKWFKEDITTTALASKKCQTGADDVAPSITVDYADVVAAGAKGIKYIISIHDNFDPTSSSSPCDITDTITVIANSKPVSNDNISYLFFDDFGNFTSDSTYEWKDILGETHKESIPAGHTMYAQSIGVTYNTPCVRAYNFEDFGATLSMPYMKDDDINNQMYNHGHYAIAANGAYPTGVVNDNSGTTTGGMLQFDLAADGSQDEFFAVELKGLLTGKEYSFGTDFASISQHPGHIKMSLEYDGKTLASGEAKTENGSDGWKSIVKYVTVDPSDVDGKTTFDAVLKIKHINVENYSYETGDYAIDNIFVSTIVSPAVAIESSITGDSLLSLCTKPLTLTAEMSKSGKDAYKALNYLFQYTYSDPSSADAKDIVWKDLADVQEENTITISSPSKHESFAELVKDESLKIYFRVIAGEKEDLKNGSFSSASISEIPIVAGLDCTQSSCSQIDANSTVAITPNPASTKVSIVADGEVEKVEFINVVGEVVKVNDETEINVSDLSNGLYFVRTTIDGEITVHKLVISK